MSDNKRLADYSDKGLGFEKSNRGLTYLYGLSDFWATTFKDTETVNLLMEATSFEASEIYNKFLQLTANISLEDIQTKFNSQIELVYLTEADLVTYPSTYGLSGNIANAKFIANRPFLPTSSLELGVDFSINETAKTITLAKTLSDNNFIYKILPDGTKKYALWLVDVKIDNHAFYTEYASLLQIEEPSSITDAFKNFIYGMYYLYINGPNLDLIRRGLNIALGIPISRDDEKVLEIRKYLETDQYLVITSLNSYLIPYGLEPSVAVDQEITLGTGLANWVEIKDYHNDGDWWVNLRLPKSLIPNLPDPLSRYATIGSPADLLMRNYLKTHTFLVNIKTTTFKNIQDFAQLSQIIHTVKPSYTSPVYIWSMTLGSEELNIEDSLFTISQRNPLCIPIGDPVTRFVRNSEDPLYRSCPMFTRFSGAKWVNDIIGRNPDLNGEPSYTSVGLVEGFINQNSAIRRNTQLEDAWIRATWSKGGPYYYYPKSYISRLNTTTLEMPGTGYNYLMDISPGFRVINLYCTTRAFIEPFFTTNSIPFPSRYTFTLFDMEPSSIWASGQFLRTNFDDYMIRNPNNHYLQSRIPPDSYKTFTPQNEDIQDTDFLIFVKISDILIGVYWATTNISFNRTPYWEHTTLDIFSTRTTGFTTHGMARNNQPAYMIRNYISSETSSLEVPGSEEINGSAINAETGEPVEFFSTGIPYTDTQNTNVPLSRAGTTLTFKRDWLQ